MREEEDAPRFDTPTKDTRGKLLQRNYAADIPSCSGHFGCLSFSSALSMSFHFCFEKSSIAFEPSRPLTLWLFVSRSLRARSRLLLLFLLWLLLRLFETL